MKVYYYFLICLFLIISNCECLLRITGFPNEIVAQLTSLNIKHINSDNEYICLNIKPVSKDSEYQSMFLDIVKQVHQSIRERVLSIAIKEVIGKNDTSFPSALLYFIDKDENKIPTFPNILQIQISSQNVTGNIPDFSLLPQLQILDLHNNKFSGKIPSNLSKLTELYELNLSNNNLSEEIPSSLSHLTKLRRLGLYRFPRQEIKKIQNALESNGALLDFY